MKKIEFTQEQKDHICYVIGDWYVIWKNKIIADYENQTHRLGVAKEQLKIMICDGEDAKE